MNILFIAYSEMIPHEGGVQRVTSIIAQELKGRGHNVYYLCATNKTDNDEIAQYPPSVYLDKPIDVPFDKQTKNHYLSHLRNLKINIVIYQYPLFKKSKFFFKYTPKDIPLISCVHIQPFYSYKQETISDSLKGYLYNLRELMYIRRAYNRSTKLCLLSDRFIPRIKSHAYLLSTKKLVAINNPNTYESVSTTVDEKENAILYVGRLTKTPKNVHDFISMWRSLQQHNPDWKAYIVGDGPDRERLEQYAEAIGCQHLSFEGNQRNVNDYYAKSKFICLTSSYEGWGMVLTEGMAYGCIPCAYGTYESVYDIIDNDKCGFVTTPFLPQEMADKIQMLIDNPDQMKQFSERVKEKIQVFSPNVIADKWERLFSELVKK